MNAFAFATGRPAHYGVPIGGYYTTPVVGLARTQAYL